MGNKTIKTEPGEIITFFSYKGGTGRTMALANIACLLAAKNSIKEKILIIDWDLEAPGLDRYFFQDKLRIAGNVTARSNITEEEQSYANMPGLIELFEELSSRLPKKTAPGGDQLAELFGAFPLDDYLIPVENYHGIFLLKAGRFDKEYARKVNSFNWEQLYKRSPYFFQAFATYLANRYKYVLIDSRTGLTDISSICTSLMPEKLVVVFTPNLQSLAGINGLVEMATEFRRQSDDLRPLLVYPLPSRIESTANDEERLFWRKGAQKDGAIGYQPMFEKLFKNVYGLTRCDLDPYFAEVQIQQTPYLAYGEKIVVKMRSDEDRFSVARSFRNFFDWLEPGYFPWESLQEAEIKRGLDEIQTPTKPGKALKKNEIKKLKEADEWANNRQSAGDYPRTRLIRDRIYAIYRRTLGPDHPDTLTSMNNLAIIYKRTGDINSAVTSYRGYLEICQRKFGSDKAVTRKAADKLYELLMESGDFRAAAEVKQIYPEKNRLFGSETITDFNSAKYRK